MSCGNVNSEHHGKTNAHSWQPLAYIPIGTWVNKETKGILQRRLYHHCLDIILASLKEAAQTGYMMTDPEGNVHNVFTPFASHIADHTEQHLVTCTAQNTSPISQASTEQFGDVTDYPIRTAYDILELIEELEFLADPDDLVHYEKIAGEHQLNGVNKPFWRDWYLVNPSFLPNPDTYLTPDKLHQWYCFLYDHLFHWAINLIGPQELDFRMSIL